MADDLVKHAIDVMAHSALAIVVNEMASAEPEWGDWPEIGEHDWEAIMQRVRQLGEALRPPPEQTRAAYEFLSGRAEQGVIAFFAL